MSRFKFIRKEEAFEGGRSGFANRICKLIHQQNGGDIDKSIKEGEYIFNDLNEFVRNIYELIDTEIPLMAYAELKEHGADNYGFSDEEYEQALESSKKACVEYYS